MQAGGAQASSPRAVCSQVAFAPNCGQQAVRRLPALISVLPACVLGPWQQVCATIKESLDLLPGDERTQVAFITFDK